MYRCLSRSLWAAIGLSVAGLLGVQGGAVAQDFYAGKTIQIIAPYSPGGTYDAMSRLIAQHMGRHIPGNPEIIVQNRPGGGGIIGARAAYTAKPDGLTLTHMPSTLALQQVLGSLDDIDFRKWEYLGSAGGANYVLLVRDTVPYTDSEGFQKADPPLRIGILAQGSLITEVSKLGKELAGYNFQLIPGYKGSNDIALAARQGELDGYTVAVVTIIANPLTKEMMDEGLIRIAAAFGGAPPHKDFADAVAKAPKIRDAITDPADREIYDAFTRLLEITRPFMTTPGTPPERVAILRDAFWKVLHDPEFAADAEKQGFVLAPVGPDQTAELIGSLFRMAPEREQRFKELVQ